MLIPPTSSMMPEKGTTTEAKGTPLDAAKAIVPCLKCPSAEKIKIRENKIRPVSNAISMINYLSHKITYLYYTFVSTIQMYSTILEYSNCKSKLWSEIKRLITPNART